LNSNISGLIKNEDINPYAPSTASAVRILSHM
jgi:hypothetical protein